MLIEVNRSEISSDRRSENGRFADEMLAAFVKAGYPCAQVSNWPKETSAGSKSSIMGLAIHRAGLSDEVRVFIKKGNVYLERR